MDNNHAFNLTCSTYSRMRFYRADIRKFGNKVRISNSGIINCVYAHTHTHIYIYIYAIALYIAIYSKSNIIVIIICTCCLLIIVVCVYTLYKINGYIYDIGDRYYILISIY